jgi:hypothetical protein
MRKILMAAMIMVAAVTGMAFSDESNNTQKSNAQYWYELIPNGDPDNYLDYQRVSSQPCSGSSSNVCGVFAEQYSPSDIEHPNLDIVTTTVFKP